jgi:adenine deaminase
MEFNVEGNIVDVLNAESYKGVIRVKNGRIHSIERKEVSSNLFILPGFIDAHVHVESSMLIPTEFARLAVPHGTVATVSDPHEIGNVLGIEGVKYMIENGKKVPFKFYFGAPSCVPATPFETAGAEIGISNIEELLKMPEIVYLAEMMNFPGVLQKDPTVMRKIELAHHYQKVVDGHAPGLRGKEIKQYISAGISTDHECFTSEEALEKLNLGMKILIREGSAAKNFDALIDLMHEHWEMMMFCSDDKHPNDLVGGHINLLVKRALKKGIDLFKVLRAACVNPVLHYQLKVGLLQKNDPADFIVVDNFSQFNILATYCEGQKVAEAGKSNISSKNAKIINNFICSEIDPTDLVMTAKDSRVKVIAVEDGQLITNQVIAEMVVEEGQIKSNVSQDILKLVVVNRYTKAQPAVAFVQNVGLKQGAFASSVAHDSHNIIAVGTNDEDLANAINLIVKEKGGVSASNGNVQTILSLAVAGLMSTEDGYVIASKYEALDKLVKDWGSTLQSPYMTLSFLALLVIPELKLSDKGLFDGSQFGFTSLFEKEN